MSHLENHLRNQFKKKYRPKTRIERSGNMYYVAKVVGLLFLAGSAFASWSFWHGQVSIEGQPQISFVLTTLISVGWSVLLGYLADKAYTRWYAGQGLNVGLAVIVLGMVAFGGYADYKGAPALALKMGKERPVDQKTGTIDENFKAQMATIEKNIEDVKARYYWCPTHRTNHRGEEKCKSTRFFMGATKYVSQAKVNRDKARLAELEEQQASAMGSYNSQRELSMEEHSEILGDWKGKLNQRTVMLQYSILTMTLLFLIIERWCHDFGAKIRSEDSAPAPSQPEPSYEMDPDLEELYRKQIPINGKKRKSTVNPQ
ncbi:MAG: hypothetical protein AAFP92_30425 [Bacteroidota bacterium]